MDDLLVQAGMMLEDFLVRSGYPRESIDSNPNVRRCALLACAMEIEDPEHGLDNALTILHGSFRVQPEEVLTA